MKNKYLKFFHSLLFITKVFISLVKVPTLISKAHPLGRRYSVLTFSKPLMLYVILVLHLQQSGTVKAQVDHFTIKPSL